jgi:hypothetical protein
MMLIKGKAYRTNPSNILQLRVLRKVKTEFGLSWKQVQDYMIGLDDETPMLDVISDAEFQAWVWAWVANAGDVMTMDELGQLTIHDIEFTNDGEDLERAAEEPETTPDPHPAPTGSGRGDAKPKAAAKRKSASTKTSRPRSTPASS